MDKPEMLNVPIWIPKTLNDWIEEQAKKERRSRSSWIRYALEDLKTKKSDFKYSPMPQTR